MIRPRVLVAGAPAAGVTSLLAALRERLPDVDVLEACDGDVAVAVLAVSAVAGPVPSDHAVLDAAAVRADAVVGAVTKVDAHRRWRDVLAEVSARYRDVPWVATAAAPQLGPPDVDAAVSAIRAALRTPPGADAVRTRRLRACRGALLRDHRSASRTEAAALRTGVQHARLDLSRFTRDRCARLRTELRAVAAEMPRRSAPVVEQRLQTAAETLLRDVDARIHRGVAGLAERFDTRPPDPDPVALPDWDGPATASRRAERGLTLALGAGFGLGSAVAAGRVFAALAPWAAVAAHVAGAVIGVLLTAWLVSTRELLHDRAAMDRWVCDVVALVRGHAEDRVAGRLLDVEAHVSAVLAARSAEESERIAAQLTVIDAELRARAGHR